jgi:hypothetical protein
MEAHMSNLAALGMALLTFLISALLGGLVWLATGSQSEGWIVLLIALNPVWLLVARYFDPRQIRWR